MEADPQVLSFAQLAGVLVAAVKELANVAKGEQTLKDKELEQKLDIVNQVMSLGFSMPPNMALSMHQILVQLLITERIDLTKDFLITKVLGLISKVMTALRLSKTNLDHKPLAITVLEQVKWTLFVIKDRETQQKFSPQMSLQCIEHLAQIFRAFSPI